MPRYDIDGLKNDPYMQALRQRDPASYQRILSTAQAANSAAAAAPRGAGTFSVQKPVMATVTRRQKTADEATDAIRIIDTMNELWNNRIQPKLKTGQITSTNQGLRYVYPTTKGQVDPDVDKWMRLSGQLSVALMAYYTSASGGRGGVRYYNDVVKPHVPYPPASMRDITGSLGYFGDEGNARQWNLEQMGGWPSQLKQQILIREGKLPPSAVLGPSGATSGVPTGVPSPALSDPYGLGKHGLKP
jgi:hypothetical protein